MIVEAKFEGKEVLEVGSGAGRLTFVIAPLVKKVIAITPFEDELKKAKASTASLPVDLKNKITFLLMDGRVLAFPNHSFDIVFFSHSLHHIPADGQAQVIKEAERVLRAGGKIVFFEPLAETTLMQIYRHIYDERELIKNVQKEIDKLLNVKVKKDFHIEYIFDSVEEVVGFFEHSPLIFAHIRPGDAATMTKVAALAKKLPTSDSKIIMSETLRLIVAD
jgi:ubiquinone/menaquinone biosynthesis C-methylase UbiE